MRKYYPGSSVLVEDIWYELIGKRFW